MDLATFIEGRRDRWGRLEEILQKAQGSGLRSLSEAEAVEFGRLYRSAASDLNQAQTFVRGDATAQYLNHLVAQCYLLIHARTRPDLWGTLRFLVLGYPVVFRRHFRMFLLAVALFALGTAFGYAASAYEPEVARTELFPAGFHAIRPSRDGEDAARPLGAGELAAGSSFYFRNNVSVSFVAFALGMTFGVGSAWVMFYNGLLLGVLGAEFVEAGQLRAFLAEVVPHSVLEVPAFLIAGAAGFVLASGLIRARPWPRLEQLAESGREALYLVSGCVPLLAAAGVLEIGVARAPSAYLGAGIKLSVGAVFGLLFVAYLVLGGRKPGGTP